MISPLRYLTRSQFWNISISWRKVYVCQSIFELVVCYKQTHITLLCIHIPMWLIPVVRVKFSYSTINENDDNDKSTWMICLRKNVSILRHQFFQLKSETIWSTFTIIHKNLYVKWFLLDQKWCQNTNQNVLMNFQMSNIKYNFELKNHFGGGCQFAIT